MRMARKPSAVARELLRNLPKSGGGKKRRRRSKRSRDGEKGKGSEKGAAELEAMEEEILEGAEDAPEETDAPDGAPEEGEIDLDELEPAPAPVSDSDLDDDPKQNGHAA
jgi:ribonuclease E